MSFHRQKACRTEHRFVVRLRRRRRGRLDAEMDHPRAGEQSMALGLRHIVALEDRVQQQVKEIHGMDLGAPPPGPMPQQVIDSHF